LPDQVLYRFRVVTDGISVVQFAVAGLPAPAPPNVRYDPISDNNIAALKAPLKLKKR
jgi:hypothetical protein